MRCAECGQSFENEIDAVIQNHEPCATKHGTQPTAIQQLKAEILRLLEDAKCDLPIAGMWYSENRINEAIAKLSAL